MTASKHKCFSCKVNRLFSDYPENKLANEESKCYFCFFSLSIKDLQNDIIVIKQSISNLVVHTDTENGSTQEDNNQAILEECKLLINKTEANVNNIETLNRRKSDSVEDISTSNYNVDDSDFIVVNNGVPPKVSEEFVIETHNPFSLLEIEESETNTFLIGSAIVQNMNKEFVLRNPNKRLSKSIPGGLILDVENEYKNLNIPVNSLACTMIGSNDVYKKETRTDDLVNKYRNLIKTLKEKTPNVLCIGILPRNLMGLRFLSKAIYFNTCLEKVCKEENVHYENFWNDFEDSSLFRRDGVHLNEVGDARLGRLIDKAVNNIHRKNRNINQDFQLETIHPHQL